MSRASDLLADELHKLTFETIISEINRYREAVDADGKPCPQPVPPALLAQAAKLLKDNGIDSPQRAKKLHDSLADSLPSFEDVAGEHNNGLPN